MKVQSRDTGIFIKQELKFMGEFLKTSNNKLLEFLAREAQRKAASIIDHKKDEEEPSPDVLKKF
jgi:hypothetical protein